MPSVTPVDAALPDLNALDLEALKALVVEKHTELVEHRADDLVKALNAAAGGQPGALDAYIQAFRTLDTLPSGEDFKRWFG